MAAVVALFIATLALPFTAQAQTYYDFTIAGVHVTSANCTDLTVIKGVTGKADYNPDTQTLTLENATINADDEYGLRNDIKGLTIHLVGENTITSEQKNGIFNWYDRSLTFTGNGKLTVKGATTGKNMHQSGISNNGTITVKNCHLQAEGGVYGLDGGQWIFDNCTVRAKGGDSSNPDASSISTLRNKTPEFKNCGITSPAGAVWKKDNLAGFTYFTLVTADGKPVTDWVEIKPISVTKYKLTIAGTQVTSLNCTDLSVIEGVEGTAKYDPDTKILTLEDAKITNNAEENGDGSGVGLVNKTNGLTIVLVGNNTITSEKSLGIWNSDDNSLTFTGNGKLTVKGAMSGNPAFQKGMLNRGTLTVKGCTLEAEAGVSGLVAGHWIFDHCTVRAKGGGSNEDPNKGSICWMWEKQPEFEGCSITTPEGAVWKEWKDGSQTYFTLFTKDDKAVTDWVEITPAIEYDLKIAGTQVNSLNCADLSVIDGVSGTAKYDPDTKTLTLENAHITNNAEENDYGSGVGLVNKIDGLTINLVGNNTITSEKSIGIWNIDNNSLIGNGKLTVKGAMSGDPAFQRGIFNRGTLTVKDCTLEAEAGVSGLVAGHWIFDHCTVRAKGGGSTEDPYAGSIGYMWSKQPEFKGCSITSPEGAVWKQWEKSENTYFTLFTKDDKAVTDWVEITPAIEYDLKIAGTQVTSENYADLSVIDGVEGTAKYDPDTKTLTLDDATIVSKKQSSQAIMANIDGLTIKVTGINKVKGHTTSITTSQPLTIKGEGTLYVESATDCAIYAANTHLTIEKSTVHAKGVYGIAGIQGFSEQLTLRNATVTAEGTSGSIADFAQLNLEGCAITTPAGAAFDAALKGVALNGERVTNKVVIAPVATAIDTPAADNAAQRGIYTLTGIRLKGDFNHLPAGVYIVNGKKVVKQ